MDLTREAVLAADDLQIEAVEVPEWGGTVHVRTISAAAVARWSSDAVPEGRAAASMVALSACDAEGKRLFTEKDVDALNAKGVAPVSRIAEVAMRINGLTEEAVKEAEKNSDETGSDTPGSVSPNSADASTSAGS